MIVESLIGHRFRHTWCVRVTMKCKKKNYKQKMRLKVLRKHSVLNLLDVFERTMCAFIPFISNDCVFLTISEMYRNEICRVIDHYQYRNISKYITVYTCIRLYTRQVFKFLFLRFVFMFFLNLFFFYFLWNSLSRYYSSVKNHKKLFNRIYLCAQYFSEHLNDRYPVSLN